LVGRPDATGGVLKTPAYRYSARLVRAVDGDTGVFLISLGFMVTIELRLRIADVNTPERGEKGYFAAQDFLTKLLEGKPLIVETHKLKTGADARTFERYVADAWVDGKSVAKELIDSGHGKAVDG
jgi:endonuclease YncB( thermonuclease family)